MANSLFLLLGIAVVLIIGAISLLQKTRQRYQAAIDAGAASPVQGALIRRHLALLLALVGISVVVGLIQMFWWQAIEEMSFGWLVPIFVAYMVYDRWERIVDALIACAKPGSPRVAGVSNHLLAGGASMVAVVSAIVCIRAFRDAWAHEPGDTAAFLFSAAAAGMMLSLLFLFAPFSPKPVRSGAWADARWNLVTPFVFPALIWLISAPVLPAVDHAIASTLSQLIGSAVNWSLSVLGYPPMPFVIGRDASGIRSLIAVVFAGSFLGASFFKHFRTKLLLLAICVPWVVFVNFSRVLFWAIWFSKHRQKPSPLGSFAADYVPLSLACGGMILAAMLLARRESRTLRPQADASRKERGISS